MDNQPRVERRRYPRLIKELPLKLICEDYDLVTRTRDISCIGAYCCVDKYIPPMTKLAIVLLLPTDLEAGSATEKVQCKGVVVRTDNNEAKGFNIAIFFNEISERNKDKISRYVSRFIPS